MAPEPNATSPNTVGGNSANVAATGVVGAAIGGGGKNGSDCGYWATTPCLNRVSGNYGTIGGGRGNSLSGLSATIAGGEANAVSNDYATIAGGTYNAAGGFGSVVAGGTNNSANGNNATVPGGGNNAAAGANSFAAGSRAKANHQGSFVWADSTDADFASNAQDEFAARAGGGVRLVVGTGAWRIEPNATSPNVVGGYGGNTVTSGAAGAAIGGGGSSGNNSLVTDDYGTVAGGLGNQAGDGLGTTSDKTYATVGGGYSNIAGGGAATIGGGYDNTANGWRGTVAGGEANNASGDHATVGGGWANTASGDFATVAGGRDDTAGGDYSFAAGRRAKATNKGSFVWGDSTDTDVTSSADNQFKARASGGVIFYSNSGMTNGVQLAAGGGTWSSVSDRNLKEHFATVDGRDLLDRLAQVPVTTWNYKSQDASIRHIGPVAQDFYAAFGVGEDDRHIATIDADGVALAASQALYRLAQEQAGQIAALQAQNAALGKARRIAWRLWKRGRAARRRRSRGAGDSWDWRRPGWRWASCSLAAEVADEAGDPAPGSRPVAPAGRARGGAGRRPGCSGQSGFDLQPELVERGRRRRKLSVRGQLYAGRHGRAAGCGAGAQRQRRQRRIHPARRFLAAVVRRCDGLTGYCARRQHRHPLMDAQHGKSGLPSAPGHDALLHPDRRHPAGPVTGRAVELL